MAIYRREGSRFWWVSVYRGAGRGRLLVSTGTEDRGRALDVEAQLRAAHRGNVRRDRLVGAIDELLGHEGLPSIRLADVWEVYAALPDVDLAPETMRRRRGIVRRLVRDMAENWPTVATMRDVNRGVALDFCDRVRETCAVAKTFNNIKGELGVVWQVLMLRAGCVENPWRLIPNAPTRGSGHGRAFSREEEARLLAVCLAKHPEYYGASMVGRYTGLRYKSVAHLRWSDIRDGVLYVTPSKTVRHGIKVAVPLHKAVRAWLDSWAGGDPWIFPLLQHRYGINRWASQYTDLIEAAGIDGGGAMLTFHCWRHTFRTRLAEAGVPAAVRDRLGGWAEGSKIGEKIYNHDLTELAAAIEAMD
jgi:integrase